FFSCLSAGARGFGFGFLLARITLGVGFILLRLALFDYVVAAGQRSANLFDLALDTLNGALDRFLRSALLIPHGSTFLSVVLLIWLRIGRISRLACAFKRRTLQNPAVNHVRGPRRASPLKPP